MWLPLTTNLIGQRRLLSAIYYECFCQAALFASAVIYNVSILEYIHSMLLLLARLINRQDVVFDE